MWVLQTKNDLASLRQQMIIDTWSGGHWFCLCRTFQTAAMTDWIITVLSLIFAYVVQSKPCAAVSSKNREL